MNIIPFNKPFIIGREVEYIAEAVKNEHLSGDGQFTGFCHCWLEERLGSYRSLLTHSCTGALEMAAILCNIRPGDEVIMPSFTFVSTANAFVLRGGIPIFVDIRSDTLNMDEMKIEKAITRKTKAIVPVHYAGISCEMGTIMGIAEEYDLFVVEDAAQALMSRYQDTYLGSIGHLGCLSFHETKNCISGEGGALLINDKRFIERAEVIREKGTNRSQFLRGQVDKYTWVDIGSSYLPSELVAAFLYAQLEKAEEIHSVRCELFHRYYDGLKELEEKELVRLPIIPNNCTPSGHIFYLITRNLAERTRLIHHLKECGVEAVFHYVPLHSSPAGRKHSHVHGDMSNTEDISSRLLRLPLFYQMTFDEIDQVVDAVCRFYMK